MIVFTNDGEIDPRSISTFGVSVKESSNPIGFFGTGLKYAIAVLLRTGHQITILSGVNVISFGMQSEAVRGQEFSFITMAINSGAPAPIGFTTELGKTWEVWMAYREIACNCKDEHGGGSFEDYAPNPVAGKTQIIVDGEQFESAFANRHQYILEDEPWLRADNTMEVRNYPGSHFFYRGVRVMPFRMKSLFTYNTSQALDLTEDRTVKNSWEPPHRIARAALVSTDKVFIRAVVSAKDDTLEGNLDFHGWSIAPSAEFLAVVGDLACDKLTNINPTAMKVWEEATHKTVEPREIAITKVQAISMERALDFCDRIGFQIRDAYPIKVCESLGSGTLGLANNETIYVAERVFQMGGTKQLAATLIEEYLHLRHGWADLTRELQSFLFEKLVSVGEELVGEPL
jgi:hypothetical protein